MRFRWQALASLLAYSTNTQLLPAICSAHFGDAPLGRCVLLGQLRVFLHGVLLPLACCFVLETLVRRMHLRAEGLLSDVPPRPRARAAA